MKKITLGDLCEPSAGQLKLDKDTLVDYFDISSVDNVSKTTTGYTTYSFGEAPSRARKAVKRNSILVSTVRPNLNAVALFGEETDNIPVASTGFCVLDCKKGVNPRFVFNFCRSKTFIDDMTSQATGASYPAVSDKIVRSAKIPDYSEKEQAEISDTLDRIAEVIEMRKQELLKLDELIKARFVEMFGLPGTDEFGWGLSSLGKCCELNPKKAMDSRLSSGLELSFVPMPAVSENGAIDPSDTRTYDEVKTGFTYFAENDVLFAKITPCMENGKGAVAVGLTNGIGFGSTEFHVMRPIQGVSNPYWLYVLSVFRTFRKDAEANMTGSAGQRRVPASFLDNYKIALPPYEFQEQFATFVKQVDKSKLYGGIAC